MAIDLKDHFVRAQRYTAGAIATGFLGGSFGGFLIVSSSSVLGTLTGIALSGIGAGFCSHFTRRAERMREEAVATFQPNGPY